MLCGQAIRQLLYGLLQSSGQNGRESLPRCLEGDRAQLVEVPGELGCLGDRDDHALLPGRGDVLVAQACVEQQSERFLASAPKSPVCPRVREEWASLQAPQDSSDVAMELVAATEDCRAALGL